MSWADYGFPDVTMMPCYTPAKALQLAYAERETILFGLPSSITSDYTPTIFVEETGRHFTQGSDWTFGGEAWPIPGGYINHIINLDKPVDAIGTGAKILFREGYEIKDIIESTDTTGMGYLFFNIISTNMHFLPEWSKAWIYQRYLALNLLKILEVPFVATIRTGSTGAAWQSTAQDAYDYAVTNSTTTEVQYGGSFSLAPSSGVSMTTNIYEKTGGGEYGCDIRRVEKIDVDYTKVPHLAGLPAYIYVSADNDNIYSPGYVFDTHGFPIKEGKGIFSMINLPWESEGIAQPDNGVTLGKFGYLIRSIGVGPGMTGVRWQYAGVDVSSKFAFCDDVDAIAAGAA